MFAESFSPTGDEYVDRPQHRGDCGVEREADGHVYVCKLSKCRSGVPRKNYMLGQLQISIVVLDVVTLTRHGGMQGDFCAL